ncbi:efflux RND transporter periplasmic adaptor subunit [Paracoccus aestuariivivens]|nr:efflux RND transporter periplasmic adaptor subunit [Paracoccus aestuariivivens]
MSSTTDHHKHPARRCVIGAAVFAGLVIVALGSGLRPPPSDATQIPAGPLPRQLTSVEVIRLVPADLVEEMPISGTVTPVRRAEVSAQVSGLAGIVAHRPGDVVAAGDLLVTIAPEDFALALESEQAALQGTEVQLENARSKLDRTRRLRERGAIANSLLEQAESEADMLAADVAAAKARVRLAELNRERAELRAPISGILAARMVEPGQLVASGAALLEIVDLSTVIVEALVPVGRAGQLRVGQRVSFWPPTLPERSIPARITRISPRVAEGTRAVTVYMEIDNAAEGLRAGAVLTGRVELRVAKGRLALPQDAIRTDGTDTSVTAIRDGQAVSVPVSTGTVWNGGRLVEITGDLRPGDSIVAQPLVGLAPGDPVTVVGG